MFTCLSCVRQHTAAFTQINPSDCCHRPAKSLFLQSSHLLGDWNTHVTIHPCRLCARPVAGLVIGWQCEVKELRWPIKHDGDGPKTQEVCL